jgi:uncharacterized protein (DUF305 family)
VFCLAVFATSCRAHGTAAEAPIVQPGAPGSPGRRVTAEQAADVSRVRHTAADVRFMQGMIGHHAQALEMTALVKSRTANEDFQRFALRIELSQADEIAMMQRWLDVRGERRPDAHAHHGAGAPLMPGMLTADEMRALAAATGTAFETLFLEGMIRHHEGALTRRAGVGDLCVCLGRGRGSAHGNRPDAWHAERQITRTSTSCDTPSPRLRSSRPPLSSPPSCLARPRRKPRLPIRALD